MPLEPGFEILALVGWVADHNERAMRRGERVRLSFQVAVAGPIMLGRNRYFGGGLFQHSQP